MDDETNQAKEIYDKIANLQDFAFMGGLSPDEFINIWTKESKPVQKSNRSYVWILVAVIGVLLLWVSPWGWTTASKCLIHNNFVIKEITRPLADCRFCEGSNQILVLRSNITKSQFQPLAYSSKPMLVKSGCQNWTALNTFSYNFFRDLYISRPDILKAVEENCQFFSFNTRFHNLEQALQMSESQAKEEQWYIGWSNCDPEVADILRQHYKRPEFLPDSSETSAIDWIFMGGEGRGANVHLDYVHRPSWQAQISGTKTWTLIPVPECENVCKPTSVTVEKGDIVLINTNQWYHDTTIHPGEISITIGSEYD